MIQTHICPDCQAFLVATDLTDMVLLRASHHCAAKQDRKQKLVQARCDTCGGVWFAPDYAGLQTQFKAHICPTTDRNAIYGFEVEVATAPPNWAESITVEDARFLASLRIDPL